MAWFTVRSFQSAALAILALHLREHSHLSIADNKLDRKIEIEQTSESFTRHGTRNYVSSDNNPICAGASHVLKHRFQCREIAMNVVKSCDPHTS